MVPFSARDDIPVISGQLVVQESSLVSAVATSGEYAAAGPTGPHPPGVIMAAGFRIVKEAYYGMLDAGVVEKLRGSDAPAKAYMAFEATDTTGGSAVGAAGAAVGPEVPGA